MAKTLNEILINVIIFLNILDYEVRALPGKVGISSTVNTDRIQITRQNAKIYCSCPESKKFLKLSPFWLSAANSCQPDSSWFQNSWFLDLKTLCLWAIKTLCTSRHQSTEDDQTLMLCKGMSSWSWREGPPLTHSWTKSRFHRRDPQTWTRLFLVTIAILQFNQQASLQHWSGVLDINNITTC